ncbi:MAG: 4Fe-4S dicluster domain-containing protein, partial [Clostridiaceae bacterium]|nr:4Fe-4S dicluster domain-containing protein [Clostridiaceae bacterium]
MSNYFDTKDKALCCGCTACKNICPKQCISMEEDKDGFSYPVIDKDKCIDCGLCVKVCPFADGN